MVAGRAVLAFGVWTLMKLLLELFLGEDNLSTFIDSSVDLPESVQAGMVIGIFLLVGIISVLIHFIIYRGTVKEGHGKKTGVFYLIVSVFFIVTNFYSFVVTLRDPDMYNGRTLRMISSLLFDLALTGCCIDVVYNGIMCRRLKKTLKSSEEAV